MENKLKQNNEAWVQRLRLTQQMLFSSIKMMGQNSKDAALNTLVSRAWFSGYDMNSTRMLPDGNTVAGAPFAADLQIRNEIIEEVLAGLKSRIREGSPTPRSRFSLELYEFDLLLAMCQVYQQAETFIRRDDINPYEGAALETTAYTMMHVARTKDEPETELFDGITDEDVANCPL